MRKRILLVTLLVTVVGILLMAVFFSEIYYRVSVSETERRLQTYIAKFDPSAALGDENRGCKKFKGNTSNTSVP